MHGGVGARWTDKTKNRKRRMRWDGWAFGKRPVHSQLKQETLVASRNALLTSREEGSEPKNKNMKIANVLDTSSRLQILISLLTLLLDSSGLQS